jgi:hypothetical protein
MKIVINILLVLAIIALGYLLYANILEPIEFKAERTKRENAVTDRLKQIRTSQEFYRNITGEFAGDFDTLSYVLQNGKFMIINVSGDPDDPNFDPDELIYDTTYLPAIDSINSLGWNLDSLRYVPYGEGAEFDIQADTLIYQKTKVQVVEVGVPIKTFMGRYGDPKFAKYDNLYDPNKRIKFGDMSKPNTSGNWE